MTAPAVLRPRLLLASAIVAALLGASAVHLLSGVSHAAGVPEPLAFTASGMDGAGFQNVVAVDPKGSGLVISGADVAGFHRSTDWGKTFRTANTGLAGTSHLKVATLAFSPADSRVVYAGVGFRGAGGGLLRSTDAGRSWSLLSAAPNFAGDNAQGTNGLPTEHPRSTGRLLAFDPANKLMYAATFSKGVMRSADGGQTWTPLGLAGKFLRGMAIDPGNPGTLYVAAYGDKVWKTTTAGTTGTFTQLTNAPAKTEELLVLGGTVYAAGGSAGVFRSADGGRTWTALGGSAISTADPIWMSIDGYRGSRRQARDLRRQHQARVVRHEGSAGFGAEVIRRRCDLDVADRRRGAHPQRGRRPRRRSVVAAGQAQEHGAGARFVRRGTDRRARVAGVPRRPFGHVGEQRRRRSLVPHGQGHGRHHQQGGDRRPEEAWAHLRRQHRLGRGVLHRRRPDHRAEPAGRRQHGRGTGPGHRDPRRRPLGRLPGQRCTRHQHRR